MILLQSTIDTSLVWRDHLQDINQIAQIIGTIMIIIYVIFTYKTFRQIKKQTDYQQDAFLRVESIIVKDITPQSSTTVRLEMSSSGVLHPINPFFESPNPFLTGYLNTTISSKMTGILKGIFNFDDSLYEGNYFTAVLTNYGNAEVNKVIINLNVTLHNSIELVDKKMLKEEEVHNLKIEIPEIIGRNRDTISIPLLSTASFPFFTITLKGEYYDIRNKKYLITETSMKGQNVHFHKLPANQDLQSPPKKIEDIF